MTVDWSPARVFVAGVVHFVVMPFSVPNFRFAGPHMKLVHNAQSRMPKSAGIICTMFLSRG